MFSTDSERLTVDVGQTSTLQITFAPNQTGNFDVHIQLDFGSSFFETRLLGTGAPPPPELALQSAALGFGRGRVGSPSQQGFWIANPGQDVLRVSRVEVDTARFAVAPGTLDIAPGDSGRVEVTFLRPNQGIVADTLKLHSNVPDQAITPLLLTGESWLPHLVLGVEALAFDAAPFAQLPPPGGRVTRSFSVTNAGLLDLQLTSLEVDSPFFSVNPQAATVAPDSSVELFVTYAPATGGVHQGQLLIRSDDPEREALQVALSGATLGSLGPQLEVAGEFTVGLATDGTVSRFLRIANQGTAPLHIDSLRVDSPLFEIGASALVIQPGKGDSVRVSYAGTDGEAAVLTLYSDDPLQPQVRVVLGTGTVEELPAGPVAIDFNPVPGDQGQRTLGGVAAGETYVLQLVVAGAPPINGWGAVVEYDSEQVAYVAGSFAPGGFLAGLLQLVDEAPDRLSVGGIVPEEAGRGGSGELGTLEFAVLDGFAGRAELAVTEVSWRQLDGADLAFPVRSVATLSSRAVALLGDFDGNGRIDFDDFFLFAEGFGVNDPRFDLDESGRVDFIDFFIFADAFDGSARAKLVRLAERYLGLPEAAALATNYPNPFNRETVLGYQVPVRGPVRLEVYAISGQRVRTLVDGPVVAGRYEVRWDGRDEVGRSVATGVYVSRLLVGGRVYWRKMLLLK